MITQSFFERLFGIRKSSEQIKQETEESNEENYRDHKRVVLLEAREFKNNHKEFIEFHLKKPISEVSLKEIIELGFISNHITRKHMEEIFLEEE